jgi:hypothetical protein
MKPTVESLEPYILEGRESIKLIVGHLMAVKGGEPGRMREALHEIRALRESSRRAEFAKVVHLCSHMEAVIEAAEEEGPEQVQESLEVLCDMCAHIVLYIDTVLLYADTFAMLIEFPWMRDALSRRLKHMSPEAILGDPAAYAEAERPEPAKAGAAVVCLQASGNEEDPETTLNELRALFEDGPQDANWIIDLSRLREVPLWLMGTLMSYHVALGRQGRHLEMVGLPAGARDGETARRLSNKFSAVGNFVLA